jgi:putative RecB family exonuclease
MQESAPLYSFSRVSTFEQCARKFRYRYLDQVKEAFDSIEAFMGRQVHETIEWLFGARTQPSLPTAAQAVSRYCERFDAEIAGSPRAVRVIKRDETVESYRRTGAEIVSRFHRERFLGDALETIANEKHFQVSIDGRLLFQGYIDRLAREGEGRLHVIDYKTGRRAPERFEGKEADQLEAYAVAVFAESDAEEVDLVLEFLRAGKTLRHRVERSRAAALERKLAERIAVVEDATVFPPNPGTLCDWCGYNDICDSYPVRSRIRLSA